MNSIISALLFGGGNGGGGGGSNLPSYPSDNGIYKLIYDGTSGDLGWQENNFIITLTVTNEDYSGIMDKTAAEITEAYENGQHILFRINNFSPFSQSDFMPTGFSYFSDSNYITLWGMSLFTSGTLFYIQTGNSDADDNTFITYVFELQVPNI